MAALWPGGLPQNFFLNLSDKRRPGFVEFVVDAGPPLRRTTQRNPPRDISTPMTLTQEQRILFDEFFADTLDEGALPFEWIDPMTLLVATYRFLDYPQWTQNPAATTTIYQGTLNLEKI